MSQHEQEPIVCPSCQTMYRGLDLKPGESFGCGKCGTHLKMPAATPPVVQPSANPAPPVIAPTSPGRPPVVAPSAGGPAVRPATGLPQVTPTAAGQAPLPQITPSAAPPRSAPPPRREATTRRNAPAPRGRPGFAAGRAPVGRFGPGAGRPGPGRGAPAPRREAPANDSKKGLVLASVFGGGALVVLIIVLIAVSGTSPDVANNSYAAGYVSTLQDQLRARFGDDRIDNEEAFNNFLANYADADRIQFVKGRTDGLTKADPAVAAERIAEARFDGNLAAELIDRRIKAASGDADDLWSLGERVASLSDEWRAAEAPASALSPLTSRQQTIADEVLKANPDHAQARAVRGEVIYKDDLVPLFEGEIIKILKDRTKVQNLHDKLKEVAAANAGYIPASEAEKVKGYTEQYAAALAEHRAFVDSDWAKAAVELQGSLGATLNEILEKAKENADNIIGGLPEGLPDEFKQAMRDNLVRGADGRSYVSFLRKPYVVFVEADDSWNPEFIATTKVLDPLTALNDEFLERHGEQFGLHPIDEPVPVVYFRSEQAYQQYCLGSMGGIPPSEAHFEPETGRLLCHADSKNDNTMIHEGTHQIFHHYAENQAEFNANSFWFQEGVAEWFGGADRSVKDKQWIYHLGRLQEDRIRFLEAPEHLKTDRFTLEELIKLTYEARNDFQSKGQMGKVLMNYSQGWALIYFLNYFDVDAAGDIKVHTEAKPVKGRYRDGWEKYLHFELKGKDGAPFVGGPAFLEAFGFKDYDDPGLKRMSIEFEAYQKFLHRKISTGQHKNKELVPWKDFRNRRGEAMGEKEDDMLFPEGAPEGYTFQ